jgi:iron-sulfur cluster assembly protein
VRLWEFSNFTGSQVATDRKRLFAPSGEPEERIFEMASPRPRPQVMRLTEAAAERIKSVMAKADRPITAVRVGVKNGGCAGMAYTMEYADQVGPLDEVVEDKGVRILVDPKAVLFLLGTEMDYKIDKLSAQFVFNNPNQTSSCGCGESVQIEPAQLDTHGGAGAQQA